MPNCVAIRTSCNLSRGRPSSLFLLCRKKKAVVRSRVLPGAYSACDWRAKTESERQKKTPPLVSGTAEAASVIVYHAATITNLNDKKQSTANCALFLASSSASCTPPPLLPIAAPPPLLPPPFFQSSLSFPLPSFHGSSQPEPKNFPTSPFQEL